MLYVHIVIASLRQFQCVPTRYVTEIKETYFEIYIYTINVYHIYKFDFKNYAFAKLVVAWLYQIHEVYK